MKSILTTIFCATLGLLAIVSPNLMAATIDDFSDLNDTVNPTWTHLFGDVGSTGQSWDASTGEYRLEALSNGVASSAGNLGFVGSIAGPSSGDVNVVADLVEPTGSPSAVATGYLVGVMAHSNGSNVPGGLTGYLFAYNQSGVAGTPRIEITKVRLGGSTSVVAASAAMPALDLLNKNYKFSLTSSGDTWTGNLYEVGGPLVATTSGTDVNSGGVAPFTSGFSGVFGISASLFPPVDATFDNFSTTDVPEPATGLLFATGAAAFLFNQRKLFPSSCSSSAKAEWALYSLPSRRQR
jgi:hypothetical protein